MEEINDSDRRELYDDSVKGLFDRGMWKFQGTKVGVLYSGGFDSTWLAHHLHHTYGAEVTLMIFDCGAENSPKDWSYDPTKPMDLIKDIDQYRRYAHFLQQEAWNANGEIKVIEIKSPNLGALTVKPELLKPADNQQAEHDEREHGLVFYSGFVMLRMTAALSIAAAQGIDYIVTGHMDWNAHYWDESKEFADLMTGVFKTAYGSRIEKMPEIVMPLRDMGVTKADLIRFNANAEKPLDPADTISCNVSVLRELNDPLKKETIYIGFELTKDLKQIHCGKCQHCLDRQQSFIDSGYPDTAYYGD